MIRVLHIVGRMNRGGQETFIMNVYRSMHREDVQFDFIVHGKQNGDYEDEIRNLGGRIYHVTRKQDSLIKNFQEIKRIVKENHYNIVHRHTNTSYVCLDLFAAKMGGAAVLIAHSHSTCSDGHKRLHKALQPLLNAIVTERLACSEVAGKWLFGAKKEFEVIRNGINTIDFDYNENVRNKVRRSLELEDTFVIGHVGRFVEAKNHKFLFRIFIEILKNNPSSKLVLIGTGPLQAEVITLAEEMHIADEILFLGVRDDINYLEQAMDVFVLPSLYEGLPVSLVEAEASGLPVIMSDTITEEVCLTSNIKRMSLNSSASDWAFETKKLFKCTKRVSCINQIKAHGFDIEETANQLAKLYSK